MNVLLSGPVNEAVEKKEERVSPEAVPDPAEKNSLSVTDASEPDPRAFVLSPSRTLGGGVTHTLTPSDEPLEIVTGVLPTAARLLRGSRARVTPDANASSRLVIEVVRRSEP